MGSDMPVEAGENRKPKQIKTGNACNDTFLEGAGRFVYVTKQGRCYGSQENTPRYKSAQSPLRGANRGAETQAKGRQRPIGVSRWSWLALVLAGSRGA